MWEYRLQQGEPGAYIEPPSTEQVIYEGCSEFVTRHQRVPFFS